MPFIRDSLLPKNTDLRWYRDKYLAIGYVFFFVVGMSFLWRWPVSHHDAIRGVAFLGVAALCALASPQRVLVLASGLVIISVRGIVGAVLYTSAGGAVLSVISGALTYALVKWKGMRLSPTYKIKEYTVAELAIDVAVLISALFVYIKVVS